MRAIAVHVLSTYNMIYLVKVSPISRGSRVNSTRDCIQPRRPGRHGSTQAGAAARRRARGATLAEFAPALFIFFFFALFPAIDLAGVGFSYCNCISLVDLQLREAAKVPRSQAIDPTGGVQMAIPNSWRQTIMAGAANVDPPVTQVEYNPGIGNIYVTVTTTFNIRPLLQVPFFPKIPGLGAPFVTTISKSRILENPAYASD